MKYYNNYSSSRSSRSSRGNNNNSSRSRSNKNNTKLPCFNCVVIVDVGTCCSKSKQRKQNKSETSLRQHLLFFWLCFSWYIHRVHILPFYSFVVRVALIRSHYSIWLTHTLTHTHTHKKTKREKCQLKEVRCLWLLVVVVVVSDLIKGIGG